MLAIAKLLEEYRGKVGHFLRRLKMKVSFFVLEGVSNEACGQTHFYRPRLVGNRALGCHWAPESRSLVIVGFHFRRLVRLPGNWLIREGRAATVLRDDPKDATISVHPTSTGAIIHSGYSASSVSPVERTR